MRQFLQRLPKSVKASLLIFAPILMMACDASVGVSYGYYDGYSSGYYGGGRGWYHNRPYRNHCRHGRCDVQTVNAVATDTNQDAATMLASDFNIRYQSAVEILNVLSGQNTEATIQQLGVDANDLRALENDRLPSTETIVKIANHLNENPIKIKNMMIKYVQDMQVRH